MFIIILLVNLHETTVSQLWLWHVF